MRAALRLSVAPFVVGKLLTIGIIVLATWQHSPGTGLPGWSSVRDSFAQWDSAAYLQIAATGYPPNSDVTPGAPGHLWAYMPGYPLLLSLVQHVLLDDIFSGVVVSAVAELVALVFVARLVSAERDAEAARLSVWLLALVPYGVFLSVVYTESTFLACAAASLYSMRQQRYVPAALWGAAATAVRVTGIALFFAFALEYALRRGRRPKADALLALLIPLPFVALCVYAGIHAGDPRAFFHIESSASFHRQLINPWDGFWSTWNTATSPGVSHRDAHIFLFEAVSGVVGLIACVLMVTWRWIGRGWSDRGVPWSFSLYSIAVWVPSVAQPYWLSVGRYEIAFLPLLLIIADVCRGRMQRGVALVVASTGVMIYLTTLWSQGIFVG